MFDVLVHLSKAQYVPDLFPEVAYIVRPSFSYGSLRKARPNDMREQFVFLTNPDFVRKQQALSLAVESHEAQLVRYYRDVLRVLQQHGKELLMPRTSGCGRCCARDRRYSPFPGATPPP